MPTLEPVGSHNTNPFRHPVTGEPMIDSLEQAAVDIAAVMAENERLREVLRVYAQSRFWRGTMNGVWMFYAPNEGVTKKGIGQHPANIAQRALDGGE